MTATPSAAAMVAVVVIAMVMVIVMATRWALRSLVSVRTAVAAWPGAPACCRRPRP